MMIGENKVLAKHIEDNSFFHAYLFHGDTSFSKVELAKEFYKKIIEKDLENKEKVFHQIDENIFPEFVLIDLNTKNIKKEEILKLKKTFESKPILASKRCYVINNVDRFNVFSANAILKFLEEPEEGIIAILIVNNLNSVLPTIVSRCQLISLGNEISSENRFDSIFISETLEEKKQKIKNAEKLFDDIINNPRKILKVDDNIISEYFVDRNDYIKYLNVFLLLLSDMMKASISGKDVKLSIDNIIKGINFIGEEIKKQDNNVNISLSFDNSIFELGV